MLQIYSVVSQTILLVSLFEQSDAPHFVSCNNGMIHDLKNILEPVIITVNGTYVPDQSVGLFGKLIPLEFKFDLLNINRLFGG